VNPIAWPIDDDAVVRTFTLDDADELFALVEANRDRLRPWMPWERTTHSADDIREFIERSLASESDLEGNGIWVGDELAGTVGLRVDVQDSKGEIGYWIGRRFEGRGLVTRACRRFIDHGFGELGLQRLEIHAAVENARSRAVAERLGFTQEGVLRGAERIGDDFNDLVVYGLLHDGWTAP
jgi:ribosomal-protein-serine acetyltransferase